MSFLTRQTASPARIISSIPSSSRLFTTTVPVLAGGSKGPKKGTLKVAAKQMSKGFKHKKEEVKPAIVTGPIRKSLNFTYSKKAEDPDLSDMLTLHPENYQTMNLGKATTYPKEVFSKLQRLGMPAKIEAEYAKAGLPASVLRQHTLDLIKKLNAGKSSSSKDQRLILTGESGSGKSLLLIQAVSYALQAGWIVMYNPRLSKWIDSSSTYAYSPKTQTFIQPDIAHNFLSNLINTNGPLLQRISKTDGQGTVFDLARSGLVDPRTSMAILGEVMEVLAKQTQIPVMWAMDEAQALFLQSGYRAPDFTLLQSYNLSMPLLALDYLTGRKTFARGTVVAAPSYTTSFYLPSLTFQHCLDLPTTKPVTPYHKHDPVHYAHATSGLQKFEVPFGMSVEEAGGMFEIWAKKGWTRSSTDETFMSAYVGASGNPLEMGRSLSQSLSMY